MTWPKKYGGHARSYAERYVVIEELLAAGAPVGAHWVADRQSGPLLLRFGTEEQRQRFLPGIARGETYFCIGMSEPNSGSDLASVQDSRAQGGRRLAHQWPEDLDLRRRTGPLHDRAGAHGRQRNPPCRPQPDSSSN